MPRAQVQRERASDDDGDEHLSSSGSESGGYNSDSSNSDEEEEGSGEEEEEVVAETEAAVAAAKKQRVRADIDEMRLMMADMNAIKVRLQQRFAAERQAKQQRVELEDREREVQGTARRRAEEEARCRQVEVGVQTETKAFQQQMNVSQQSLLQLAHGSAGAGALSAVDGGTGFADAAKKKAKPAGLNLYDLVKAPGAGLPPKMLLSPVRQEDSPALPMRYSNEHERVSPARQQLAHYKSSAPALAGANSLLSHPQDSIVGGGSDYDSDIDLRYSHHADGYKPARGQSTQSKAAPSHHYNENSASVSNSLVSSDAGNRSAVFPDLIRQRDHKFNAATLLSTGKRAQSAVSASDDDKTDEQREMEAIQCLLFGGQW